MTDDQPVFCPEPTCGLQASGIIGFAISYYVCPNGHEWKVDND